MHEHPPGKLPPRLARLHAWVRTQGWLRRFTLANRLLLAMAFVPTGLVKLMGQRFTSIPVDNPIGYFFEAMYRTGPYWHFLGFMQLLAAVLLLIPRMATIGALLFTPIALSILFITAGMGFGGTSLVAAGMVLSVTYLLCWDADRIWAAAAPVLARSRGGNLLAGMHWLETAGWLLGGAAGIGLLLVTRSLLPHAATLPLLLVGVGAFGLVVVGWIVTSVRGAARRTGESGAA